MAQISGLTDSLELHIDNVILEDNIPETETSTASQFTTVLQKSLDLSPLMYLRSVECELTLQNFHLSSLPLSTINNELIYVYVELSPDIVLSNKWLNKARMKLVNKVPLDIPVTETAHPGPSFITCT